MAKSPPPPELVEAYRLIKADERNDAARLLKDYISRNPREPRAWWLMAHAVTQPENVRRCLENVLKLDPAHEQARQRLARMAPAPAPEPAQTAPDDEPDDSMILGGVVAAAPAASKPAPPPKPIDQAEPADPFEELAAQEQGAPSFEDYAADPFVESPVDDPFAGIPAQDDLTGSAGDEPPASGPASYDPFDAANVFDPAAHARVGSSSTAPKQTPGTGNQPEWGPGLAFVADNAAFEADGPGAAIPGAPASAAGRPKPPRPKGPGGPDWAFGEEEDFTGGHERAGVERFIGFGVIAVAVIVLVGLALFVADKQGWINLTGGGVPAMTTLDGGSFTVQYPKGWDQRCLKEAAGYPVCGMANHALYNDVAYYAGQDVNLGVMLSESFNMALRGEELPETQTSIIMMDVPDTSSSYDNGSWAKTKYEWSQSGYYIGDPGEVDYVRKEITIDGFTGYYYEYTSQGRWNDAAWDVYVPHDGIILWLRIDYGGERKHKIPSDMVQAVVDSIHIKPVEEWR